MTTLPRLSRATLATLADAGLDPAVRLPASATTALSTGIVHLGIGAFHRAHQAVFTERAIEATGDDRWGILGVTQRSATVRDQLLPQDGLYGVLELSDRGGGAPPLELIGSIRDVAYPAEETARVLATIAAPATHIVSLTVTEKGYRRAADGGPDLADPALSFDLAVLAREIDRAATDDDEPSRSAVGLLVRALARRWRAGGDALTVVVCDNLMDNGPQVERLVHALVGACPAAGAGELLDWIRARVTFPATMVDRIVPATADAHRRAAERVLGATDAGLVVAEPFRQWVIEDRFAGPRPAWELAGATFTSDVAPYEHAKLRLLNGTHSLLAYAGALRGHATIAEAVADPLLYGLARTMLDEDSIPSLGAGSEIDLEAYRDSVLERFANAAIGHTTVQVAMDGSQKLPIRLLGIARDRLAVGQAPEAVARAVAAWMLFVHAAAAGSLEVAGSPVGLDDPAAQALGQAAAGSIDGLADRMLDRSGVFPAALAGDDRWRTAVRSGVSELSGIGAATAR
ncbi:mannitol dehydrogenase family protein [Demequina sp. SYSU T00192]|uniref:Mannitol-1-phosphate 5-dehydrogenase n=1 Tax=Demequina litoralis TaxID=3051660 RepID=A0ABT8GCL1_9MICO|nr:mannitol dehydrogenase family protein [Demequina sp. SYSU T00192]MDN4476871.1 mannitol dehydrogenase family protein [Demequina sp. SYSU T00192]